MMMSDIEMYTNISFCFIFNPAFVGVCKIVLLPSVWFLVMNVSNVKKPTQIWFTMGYIM